MANKFDIESATAKYYGDEFNETITVSVKFAGFPSAMDFTASPHDVEEHGRILYAAAKAGTYGAIAAFPFAVNRQALIDEAAAKKAIKDSAIAKLKALGLTEDEALSLI
jgi:hypothetical protein